MKKPTTQQLASLEKLINNCLQLARKSPNIAAAIDLTPDDIERATAGFERMKFLAK